MFRARLSMRRAYVPETHNRRGHSRTDAQHDARVSTECAASRRASAAPLDLG
jgi:hypothetical protein